MEHAEGRTSRPESERHFSGSLTGYLIGYLRTYAPPGSLEQVLDRAGGTRTADELGDDTTWSSYGEFRRLLEAAAIVLGGNDELVAASANAFSYRLSTPEFTEVLQALGSAGALYATIAQSAAALTPIVDIEATEVRPAEWVVRMALEEGFEPFPEYCSFSRGLHTVVPPLFGFPPATAVEEECQCDGAPACVVRVRWEETIDPAQHAQRTLEIRNQILEGRLEGLQRMLLDVVSGDSLDEVLSRVVATAARAVSAPGYVLAIDPLPSASQRIYAVGLDEAEADRIVDEFVARGWQADAGRLVVEVASSRRHYGWLAAIHPDGGRFFDQELAILETYGRLAAAALDSATALDDARREAATAKALLDLSTALAEIRSTDEMAARLARAVPAVVDCDRAAVVLLDADKSTARVAAAHGFSSEEEQRLRAAIFEYLPGKHAGIGPIFIDGNDETDSPLLRALMAETGSQLSAGVPIVTNGELIGWVAAVVTTRPERLRADPILGERLRGLAGQAATAMRNARLVDEMRHQALHDSLTGLPNRTLIVDRADHMLARARRGRNEAALLFIDLDNFKAVNDTLGHAIGDRLLKAVAARLASAVRTSDSVGRLGGDEFVVLTEGVSVSAGSELVAQRLHDVLREPFRLPGLEQAPISVSASIGIAVGDRPSANELLRDADIALYRAKATGKGCTAVFEAEMQSEVLHRLELEMDLRAAVAGDEFFLVYQPILDLETMTVSGVEALLRWRHPHRGVVMPNDFIPVLEETGMIIDVGRWVLDAACAQAASWHRRGRPVMVSVNVSMRQLDCPGLVDDVRASLSASGLEARSLVLEITETALMRNADDAVRRLSELKELGVRVAIDDFGTGYSSLAYLSQFPVDALKIDRSFISGMTASTESAALIHTLVQLGRALQLETLAEGIEDPDQLEHLQREHCHSGQGFLLCRPLEADAVDAFLEAQRPRTVDAVTAPSV